MNSRNIFAYILSFLLLGITIFALLGICDIIDWIYVQRCFWKSAQWLMIVLVNGIIIYLIQSLFSKDENNRMNTSVIGGFK